MNLKLLALILKFHAAQVRVDNREDGKPDPQIEHLFRVLHKVLSPAPHWPESLLMVRANALPVVVDVTLGHDLLEDTSVEEDELKEVVHPYALEAIHALTRKNNKDAPTYQEYIEKQVAPHPVAALVKLADLEDNMATAKESLKIRYAKSRDYLLNYWRDKVITPVDSSLEDKQKIVGLDK